MNIGANNTTDINQ